MNSQHHPTGYGKPLSPQASKGTVKEHEPASDKGDQRPDHYRQGSNPAEVLGQAQASVYDQLDAVTRAIDTSNLRALRIGLEHSTHLPVLTRIIQALPNLVERVVESAEHTRHGRYTPGGETTTLDELTWRAARCANTHPALREVLARNLHARISVTTLNHILTYSWADARWRTLAACSCFAHGAYGPHRLRGSVHARLLEVGAALGDTTCPTVTAVTSALWTFCPKDWREFNIKTRLDLDALAARAEELAAAHPTDLLITALTGLRQAWGPGGSFDLHGILDALDAALSTGGPVSVPV